MSKTTKLDGHAAGESDLIDRYFDGLLSEPEREDFEARCFRDDAFFMEVREREIWQEKVARVIQEDGEELFRASPARPNILGKLAERFKNFFVAEWKFAPARLRPSGAFAPRWGFAIAAATVVAVIGFLIYKNSDRGPIARLVTEKEGSPKPQDVKPEEVPKEEDSSKSEIDVRQLYAANFAPAPHLDAWISESMRSAGVVIERVLSPPMGEEIAGREIIFQWKMVKPVPVSLRILNNREKALLTLSPDAAQFPLITARVQTEIFKTPGLYYWKIEDREDVLFVGKFLFLGKPQ